MEEELKVGDEIYFQYSKWYKDREGKIVEINSDDTYKVEYYEGSKSLYRDVMSNKIRLTKTNETIKREEESIVIDEICHKLWQEFDVEIPFLSRPRSIEYAEKLYKRIKREHYSN